MDDELTTLLDFIRSLPRQEDLPLEERRTSYDRAERAMPIPEGVTVRPWEHEGLQGQLIEGTKPSGRMLLYVHGGGFVCGSSRSHRHLAAAIAAASSSDALVLDYRLAPEHPFPAALEDTYAACRHLIAKHGASHVALAGDSAGAAIALSALIRTRDRGEPLPAALCCMSPWVDLTCRAPTAGERALIDDPLMVDDTMAPYVSAYLGHVATMDERASPVFAALAGLPPTLIQVGSTEWLRRDSIALANALDAAKVETVLEIEPESVPHVWQWYWPRLQIARDSIARIGQFLDAQFTTALRRSRRRK